MTQPNADTLRPNSAVPAATPPEAADPPAATHQPGGVSPRAHEIHTLPLPDDGVDWIGFIRREWLLMAVMWLMLMTGVAVALHYWPREYTSSARFLVKNARQDLVVGPNETASASVPEGVSEEVLNTELELLRSWDSLTQIVRDLKLHQPMVDAGKEPAMAEELATHGLLQSLNASALRKTNIVQISYTSRDPQLAAAIVGQVVDRYLAAHLTIHSSPGTYELFKAQAADASTELRRAEEELASLARSSNLVVLDTQKQDALKSVQELEAQVNAISAEMKEQQTRARIAEVHLSSTTQRVPTIRRNVPAQSSVEHLHTMAAELTNKRTEALTKFQPTDRLVVEIDQQIADTNAALERAKMMSANEESTDINPSWQALEGERTKARLAHAGLESKNTQLQHELEEQRARTLQITEAGPRYDELSRHVTEARNRYELYAKKEEEARIAEVLDRQRISNVVLAQAPSVSHVPSKPNVRLGLVTGAVLAAVGAVAVAFLRELLGAQWSRRRRYRPQLTVLGITPATAELQ